jgi:hypothetical protein
MLFFVGLRLLRGTIEQQRLLQQQKQQQQQRCHWQGILRRIRSN